MAVSFTTVPEVAVGEAITSTQLTALSDAFNDRLRSGLGDGTWRIHYYWLGLFRQLRNSDESGYLWPPQHEFFTFYQMIDPQDALYPDASAGEPEGINVSNPAGGFVFGRDAYDIENESGRITDPELGGIPLSVTASYSSDAEYYWELGKAQRGAYDPQTGSVASPSFTAARSHWAFQYSIYAQVGNSYGGFLPTPEYLGDCADGTVDLPATKSYEYFFTSLKEDLLDYTYPGSCPEVEGNVQGIARMPWAYYIYVWRSGAMTVDILSTKDYIEGPYSGGNALHRTSGEQLPRALNAFIADFRGTEEQRESSTWNSKAFDFQRFFSSQYILAPQVGFTDAEGVTVTPEYPLFSTTGSTIASGTYLTHQQTIQTERAWTEGTACTGFLAKSSSLVGEVTLEVLDGGDIVSTVTLSESTTAKVVNIYTALLEPNISVRTASSASFTTPNGGISLEFTELMQYSPEIHDAYLVLRASSTKEGASHDGSGIWEESSKEIGDSLYANHCVYNVHGSEEIPQNEGQINKNAVFDAVRRLSTCIRNVPRQNIVGYEVVDGKSVLYVNRYALGMSHSVPIDLLSGIGPGRSAVSSLTEGREYVVRTGSITYSGSNYTSGQTFTASNVSSFSGSGEVYEVEGIQADAPKYGFSNEWLLDVDFHVYHPSDSSIWKPSSYSDYYWSGNRCLFYSPEVEASAELRWHYNYGSDIIYNPEAPSGYNYARGANDGRYASPTDKVNFYKSCRIYETPMEIESAVVDGTNYDIIKLTLKTRLHHAASAPASISRDVSTWVDGFMTEDYRTAENGIRQYLYLLATGTNAPFMLGDCGLNSSVASLPDNPYGAVFPLIRLTRLIRKPYEDDNNTPQSHDSKLLHDDFQVIESYLRAMCEGYVDGYTTGLYGCQRSDSNSCDSVTFALFDYSYENLFYDAGEWRSPTLLSPTQRTDLATGYGPLPNTTAASALWNQLARAVNKLTRVRLPIPLKFQTRYDIYQDTQYITSTQSDGGSDGGCSTTSARHSYWKGTPDPAQTLTSSGAWADDTAIQVRTNSGVDMTSCIGTLWPMPLLREVGEYRVVPLDSDVDNVFPELWSDMAYTSLGCIACRVTWIGQATAEIVSDGLESGCFGTTSFYPTGDGRYWKFTADGEQVAECVLIDSGTLEAAPQGPQVYDIGRTAGSAICSGTAENSITITPYVDETAFLTVPLV